MRLSVYFHDINISHLFGECCLFVLVGLPSWWQNAQGSQLKEESFVFFLPWFLNFILWSFGSFPSGLVERQSIMGDWVFVGTNLLTLVNNGRRERQEVWEGREEEKGEEREQKALTEISTKETKNIIATYFPRCTFYLELGALALLLEWLGHLGLLFICRSCDAWWQVKYFPRQCSNWIEIHCKCKNTVYCEKKQCGRPHCKFCIDYILKQCYSG